MTASASDVRFFEEDFFSHSSKNNPLGFRGKLRNRLHQARFWGKSSYFKGCRKSWKRYRDSQARVVSKAY